MRTLRNAMIAIVLGPIAASAQVPSRTKIESTTTTPPSVKSTLQVRAVLTKAIDAAGGLAALRTLQSISTDRSTLRTTTGQGLRPSVPSVSRGVQLTRL